VRRGFVVKAILVKNVVFSFICCLGEKVTEKSGNPREFSFISKRGKTLKSRFRKKKLIKKAFSSGDTKNIGQSIGKEFLQ